MAVRSVQARRLLQFFATDFPFIQLFGLLLLGFYQPTEHYLNDFLFLDRSCAALRPGGRPPNTHRRPELWLPIRMIAKGRRASERKRRLVIVPLLLLHLFALRQLIQALTSGKAAQRRSAAEQLRTPNDSKSKIKLVFLRFYSININLSLWLNFSSHIFLSALGKTERKCIWSAREGRSERTHSASTHCPL